MKKLLTLLGIMALFLTQNVMAGSGAIFPVQIESISVIGIGSPYNTQPLLAIWKLR